MNGNKYENIKLSIDSSNSYLRALKFLSNFSSKRRTKDKKTNEQTKQKHRLCVVSQVFNVLPKAISRPRKQRISGFFTRF